MPLLATERSIQRIGQNRSTHSSTSGSVRLFSESQATIHRRKNLSSLCASDTPSRNKVRPSSSLGRTEVKRKMAGRREDRSRSSRLAFTRWPCCTHL